MSIFREKNENFTYIVPTSIECIILTLVAVFGKHWIAESPNLIACSLLFAMGLQNALVTRISNSVIRTTHLTGLFTDLGIEISQLLFHREIKVTEKLTQSIRLKFTIISFFFVGGIVGGIFYSKVGLTALLLGSITLIGGIIYDNLKRKVKIITKRYRK